jgi:hypothetical protein
VDVSVFGDSMVHSHGTRTCRPIYTPALRLRGASELPSLLGELSEMTDDVNPGNISAHHEQACSLSPPSTYPSSKRRRAGKAEVLAARLRTNADRLLHVLTAGCDANARTESGPVSYEYARQRAARTLTTFLSRLPAGRFCRHTSARVPTP